MDNKSKGVVKLPAEAGSEAHIQFTMEALEELETAYGEDYFDKVLSGLSKARVGIYRKCIEIAGKGITGEFPYGMALSDVQVCILDAIFYAVYGRSYEEQKALDEEVWKQKAEEAKSNPAMAAALLSQMSVNQDTEQG